MKKRILKKIFIISISIIFLSSFSTITYAQEQMEVDGINIMKKLEDSDIENLNNKIKDIGSEGGKVMEKYRDAKLSTSQQIASGIMNRDTIMNYLVFLVQFLSQLGLVVGAGFIMFAGYKYMISVFNGGKVPSSTVKNAIIGVMIVIFSYAIMRILTSFIGLT